MSTPTDPTRQMADYEAADHDHDCWECQHDEPHGGSKRMRALDRVMIAVGMVLVALVVVGIVAGTVQDSQFAEDTTSVRPVDVVLLAVGALLVLAGVIRDALHRRGPS